MKILFTQSIPAIVEAMLASLLPMVLGLAITLDLRENNYNTNISSASIVQFIFKRPSNYTLVLANYRFNNFRDYANPKYTITPFAKQSDHDSCWRSDGLSILGTHRDNMWEYYNQNRDISKFYTFSIFQPIQYVKFDVFEPIKNDDGYVIGYNVKYEDSKENTFTYGLKSN